MPLDPATNERVTDARARIDHLIEALEERRETIVIPTPALSEVLVHANEAGPEYLEIPNTTRCFRIEPFDQRAAVELATMTREALREGNLRGGTQSTRAKLKFDRQIIAIARSQNQTTDSTTSVSPETRRDSVTAARARDRTGRATVRTGRSRPRTAAPVFGPYPVNDRLDGHSRLLIESFSYPIRP